jgi:hypothetical protein
MGDRKFRATCLAAFCLGLGAVPAHAISNTWSKNFVLNCDGGNHKITWAAPTGQPSTYFNVTGAAVSLNDRTLVSLQLKPVGNPIIILTVGAGESTAHFSFTDFEQLASDPSGNVSFDIVGSCGGGGKLNGTAVVYWTGL